MRGWTITVVIIVCAAIIVGLFHFLFKNQMDKKVKALEAQNHTLQEQIEQIKVMEAAIDPMARDIPRWKQKIDVYRAAVPAQIEDNVFFRSLRQEMNAAGVSLLAMRLDPGGSWLGEIKDDEAKKLEGIGVDVAAARSLKVAFYSIELLGPYDRTLAVLENLKKHGRMYSIDSVVGPGGGGGGTITKVLDSNMTPIQVSGKIFYGLPEEYISEKDFNIVFRTVVLRPMAGQVKTSIQKVSKGLATETTGREETR